MAEIGEGPQISRRTFFKLGALAVATGTGLVACEPEATPEVVETEIPMKFGSCEYGGEVSFKTACEKAAKKLLMDVDKESEDAASESSEKLFDNDQVSNDWLAINALVEKSDGSLLASDHIDGLRSFVEDKSPGDNGEVFLCWHFFDMHKKIETYQSEGRTVLFLDKTNNNEPPMVRESEAAYQILLHPSS